MVKIEDFFFNRSKSKVNDFNVKSQVECVNSLLECAILDVTKIIHHRNDFKSLEVSVIGGNEELYTVMNLITSVVPGLYMSRVSKVILKFTDEVVLEGSPKSEFRFMSSVGKHKVVIDLEELVDYYNSLRKFNGINPLFTNRSFEGILPHMQKYFDGLVECTNIRNLKTPEDDFLVMSIRFLDGSIAKVSFDSTFVVGIEVKEVNPLVFKFVATISEMLYSLGFLGISLTTLTPLYSECKIPILHFIDDTFGVIYPEFFIFD